MTAASETESGTARSVIQDRSSHPALWRSVAPLRGIAMCLVVASHASHAARGMLADSGTAATSHYPLQHGVLVAILALSLSCLIAFVFLSGFMMYRVASTSGAPLQAARQLLQKYLIWAVSGYAVLSLLRQEIDWTGIALGLIQGGPFAAYWYLTLAIVLYAVTPLIAPLVHHRPNFAWFTAVGLQLTCILEYYLVSPLWSDSVGYVLVSRVVHFLPAYMIGMLVSRNAPSIGAFLYSHRRGLGIAALTMGLVTGTEAVVMAWQTNFLTGSWAAERATAVAFSFLLLAALMTRQYDQKRGLSKWLARVGMGSLGVLLMTDMFMKVAEWLAWHVPGLLMTGAIPHGEPFPPALRPAVPLLGIALFATGILAPLLAMGLARKWIGNRTSVLW